MFLLFVVIILALSPVSLYISYPRLARCTRNYLTSPDDAPEFRTDNLWKKLCLSRRSLDFKSFWYLSLGMPIFAIIRDRRWLLLALNGRYHLRGQFSACWIDDLSRCRCLREVMRNRRGPRQKPEARRFWRDNLSNDHRPMSLLKFGSLVTFTPVVLLEMDTRCYHLLSK